MNNCAKCNAELVPVFPDRMRRAYDLPQYENALVVDIIGGYGMFIDPSPAGTSDSLRFILCGNCAKELIDQNQWLVTPEIDYLSKENIDEG